MWFFIRTDWYWNIIYLSFYLVCFSNRCDCFAAALYILELASVWDCLAWLQVLPLVLWVMQEWGGQPNSPASLWVWSSFSSLLRWVVNMKIQGTRAAKFYSINLIVNFFFFFSRKVIIPQLSVKNRQGWGWSSLSQKKGLSKGVGSLSTIRVRGCVD